MSESNYEILRNFGKTGMSFNDVISDLITKVHPAGNPYLSNSIQKLQSEQRPGNHTQTVPSPANSDV
jgi:hypothetical protein